MNQRYCHSVKIQRNVCIYILSTLYGIYEIPPSPITIRAQPRGTINGIGQSPLCPSEPELTRQ